MARQALSYKLSFMGFTRKGAMMHLVPRYGNAAGLSFCGNYIPRIIQSSDGRFVLFDDHWEKEDVCKTCLKRHHYLTGRLTNERGQKKLL